MGRMPQIISRVSGVTEDGAGFILQQLSQVVWELQEEDVGRVEAGDVVTIDVPNLGYPFVPGVTAVTDKDRTTFKLVRVSKGGDPAFQG